jgi:cytochrome c-type biogenesis protein
LTDLLTISPWIAFGAGIASFLSPCVLPLLPIYVSYLTGISVDNLNHDNLGRMRKKLVRNGGFFILGFSLVFVLLGLSASSLGRLLLRNQVLVRRIGGVVIILLGVHLSGLWKINFLYREKKIAYRPVKNLYLNSFLLGVAFSLGWTPCTGPILSGILVLAGSSGSPLRGAYLLVIYSLGMAIPFMLSSLVLTWVVDRLRFLGKGLVVLQIIVGVIMIILGILVFTGWLIRLSAYFPSIL